ncbi:MAG: M16 family metallopeptidase, partial [Fidelibacterota bacterium]
MKKSLIFLLAIIFTVSCARVGEYIKLKPAEKEVAAVELDRSIKPPPAPTPPLEIPTIQRASLENGLKLLLVEHHELPVVAVVLVIPAGSGNDPLDMPGLANFTAEMLDEGTEKRTALEIADELDFIGADLSTGSSWDASFVYLTTLKKHLKKSLEIFSDVILHPS